MGQAVDAQQIGRLTILHCDVVGAAAHLATVVGGTPVEAVGTLVEADVEAVLGGLLVNAAVVVEVQLVGITEDGTGLAGGDCCFCEQPGADGALVGAEAEVPVGAAAGPSNALCNKVLGEYEATKKYKPNHKRMMRVSNSRWQLPQLWSCRIQNSPHQFWAKSPNSV